MAQTTCPHCGLTADVPDHLMGQAVTCPQCQTPFQPNPYASPGYYPPTAPVFHPSMYRPPGMVGHVTPVAILMMVQGGLESLLGLLFLVYAVIFASGAIPMPPDENAPPLAVIGGIMGAFALLGLIPGILRIYAGYNVLHFRKRGLGVTALAVGCATVCMMYCAPTSIGLAIYGLIVLNDAAVKAAFEANDRAAF